MLSCADGRIAHSGSVFPAISELTRNVENIDPLFLETISFVLKYFLYLPSGTSGIDNPDTDSSNLADGVPKYLLYCS